MPIPAIRCDNLGKRYEIGAREPYLALRDTLTAALYAPFRAVGGLIRKRSRAAAQPSHIWAIKDLSFSVKQGEVVGIIGRNGAGKSTLLKILSRITEPTEGSAEIRGRVGSLLEVGTGFHPELTGRENIFFNGSILGMRKTEIQKKFDEIVDFADIEKFLDTPVKRYSSGMYMRLAFAVAAHLEPEVLLVDEVLAVGDVSFQKKCLNKMQQVGQQGRTVLFISHNMPAITRLCSRTILLQEGRVLSDGPSHQVVATYLRSGLGTTAERSWIDGGKSPGNDVAKLRAVRVINGEGRVCANVDIRKPVGIEMEYEVLQSGFVLVPNYHFYSEEGICAFVVSDQGPAWRRRPRQPGMHTTTAWIPGNFLSEGTMIVGTGLSTMDPVIVHFYESDAVAFHVADSLDGNSARGDYGGHIPGVVRPLLHWTNRFVGARDVEAAGECSEFATIRGKAQCGEFGARPGPAEDLRRKVISG